MVNIKEAVEDAVEDVEEAVEDTEDVAEAIEDTENVDGGIFDEDLEDAGDVVSDFDIGDTILSVASPVESWQGQNLEDTISRERVEKDWSGEDELVSGDFYKSSEDTPDAYSSGSSDVYSSSGSDVYNASGSDAYDSGKSDGKYSIQSGHGDHMKGYDQLKDDRRGSRSMLEVGGFEDKEKKKERELRSDIRQIGDHDN